MASFEPLRRYERDKPGDLIHIDSKNFNRTGHCTTSDRTRRSNSRGIGSNPAHVLVGREVDRRHGFDGIAHERTPFGFDVAGPSRGLA